VHSVFNMFGTSDTTRISSLMCTWIFNLTLLDVLIIHHIFLIKFFCYDFLNFTLQFIFNILEYLFL
jgi:hypothetical protein